jgi:hypothetical protein
LQQQDPGLLLSAAVFPFPEAERLARLQQHWETWAEAGYVDALVLMTYTADSRRLAERLTPWFNDDRLNQTLLLGSIHLLDAPDAYALDQIQLLRDLPTAGYALFANDHLSSSLRQRLQRAPLATPLPHRQPLQAALNRYQALEREWDFLQAQGYLELRETAQADWAVQRQALRQQLMELADQPNRQNLQVAQTTLLEVQAGLDTWLDIYQLKHRQQVDAWQHRLDTLSLLLDYAEPRALIADR